MKTNFNKGFTLMELIATVAVLSVLVLMAVPAYNSIKSRVLEGQYNNLVSLIETTAKKYGSNTKSTVTNVQDLIDNGLLETDDGTYIYDPRNKAVMNCYAIKIEYENGNYNAKLIEENYIDSEKKCDLEKAKSANSSVTIKAYDTTGKTNELDLKDWHQGNMYLYTEESYSSYNWVTNTGKTSNEEYFSLIDQMILKGTVTVGTTDESGNRYYGNTEVKIDNEEPIINNIEIVGSEKWNEERTIKINATDGNGSGIAGYFIGEKACKSENIEWKETQDKTYAYDLSITNNFLNETEYHVCAKDQVGNIGEYKETFKISKSDTTKPSCSIKANGTKGNYDWYRSDITFTVTGIDLESGIDNSKTVIPQKITIDGTHTVEAKVYDYAGNEGVCTTTVKKDTISPSVPTSTIRYDSSSGDERANANTWTNRTLWWGNFNATDNASGIDHYEYSTNCTGTKTGNLDEEYTYDTDRNWTFCIRAVDNAGNEGNWSDPYYFKIDKTAPTITFGNNGSGNNYVSEASTTITVSDASAGVSTNSTKYGWSTSSSSTNANTSFTSGFIYSSNCGISNDNGTCYLYAYACDNLNNCDSSRSNAFNIDKKAPVISRNPITDCNSASKQCLSVHSIVRGFSIKDDYSNTILYRSYCYGNTSTSSTNSKACYNITAIDRLTYFFDKSKNYDGSIICYNADYCISKNGISDNNTTKAFYGRPNVDFEMGTSFGSTYEIHYAFKGCDVLGNCSGYYKYRTTFNGATNTE